MGKIIHGRLKARYGSDIQARLDDTYGPKLEQRLRKSIQEIERARKAEPETGTQAGQVRAMPGGGLFGRIYTSTL